MSNAENKEQRGGSRYKGSEAENASLIQVSSSQELARMRLGGENSERW